MQACEKARMRAQEAVLENQLRRPSGDRPRPPDSDDVGRPAKVGWWYGIASRMHGNAC